MPSETLHLRADVLQRQRARADQFRDERRREGTLVVQLLASPGAGKTTLLEATAQRLTPDETMAVLVGDLATERDALRLRRFAPAVQLTTGGACHLEISLVEAGFTKLPRQRIDYLFVEDVGNLVCPASHDVGQHLRVALVSVAEGDDKPAKYPKAFRTSQALVISKSDLLPHVTFSVAAATEDAQRIQPTLSLMSLSARSGEGMDEWMTYLRQSRSALVLGRGSTSGAS